jgi:hypothetical protein
MAVMSTESSNKRPNLDLLRRKKAKIATLQRECQMLEEGEIMQDVVYGDSFTLEHRLWKIKVNAVFTKALKDKGVLGLPVLVMDDDKNPPLGTSRAVLEAAPDTSVVCVNFDTEKCVNLRNECNGSNLFKTVTVVCEDAIQYANTSADVMKIYGFYFDFCGHVDLSVRAIRAIQERRPKGGYVIGVTYTTARDSRTHLIPSKLGRATKSYLNLDVLDYKPSQIFTHIYWMPTKE